MLFACALFRLRWVALVAAWAGLSAHAALAEQELSFYTGLQEAPHSRVEGNDPGGVGPFSFLATWEGRSFEAPPHYGFRYTYWTSERLGFGIDFNHLKVYADDATLTSSGFTTLEFTDGLNVLTANVYHRWPSQARRWTPYVGAGLGISIPYVEVESPGGTSTFEYQVTGPAAAVIAGVTYEVNDRWAVFGEYKGTYSVNDADLDGGGTLSTDIVTNALNFGITFRF